MEYFVKKNWRVRALQRRPSDKQHDHITYHRFSLPDEISEDNFIGADYVVHCAYQEYNYKNRNADRVNIEGTKKIIQICRKHNIKIIFLSSFSAHEKAESHYGKNKLVLEMLFDIQRDCILRPGLVMGKVGLFGNIVDLIKKAKIIPIIDGGSQPVQIILVDDICKIIDIVTDRGISGKYNVATSQVYTMKNLYLQVVDKLHLKRYFLPVPLWSFQFVVNIIEMLRIPFGVTSENVSGLKNLMVFDTTEDLNKLGVEILSLEEAIDRLL